MSRKTLRFGNSGPALQPNPPTPGDTVVVGVDGTPGYGPPSGILSGIPWGGTFFMDPLTTVPLASQNGSANLPFEAAQAAADVCTGGDTVVMGANGTGGDVTVISKGITWYGLTAQMGQTSNFHARLGDYTFTDPTLANMVTTFVSVNVTGNVDLSVAELGNLNSWDSSFNGTVAAFNAYLRDSALNNGFTGTQIEALNTDVQGADVTVEFATFDGCGFSGMNIVATGAATFRNCNFSGGMTITCPSISMDTVSKRSAIINGVITTSVVNDLEPNPYYGDGSDGDLAAGMGVVTLTRDMFYNNVGPFDPGDTIRTQGFRVLIANLLDLTGAPAAAFDFSSGTGAVGQNAAGQTAGNGGTQVTIGSLPGVRSGTAGGKGGAAAGAGAAGVAGSGAIQAMSQTTGGKGGTGGGGGGAGAAGAGGVAAPDIFLPRPHRPDFIPRSFLVTQAGNPAATGGGGGGGAGDVGGGGGGAGTGAGVGEIWARYIRRDATVDPAAMSGIGFDGGDGGDAGAGGGCGGGGGAGGGGSPLFICYDFLDDPTAPQTFATLNGGVGGDGGDGTGGEAGGTGGQGGSSGLFYALNAVTQSSNTTATGVGTAGDGPTGSTGGAGGAGAVYTAGI